LPAGATFKITIAYEGTGFVGWQRQAAGVSIQGLIEDALRDLAGTEVAVVGAGRTDAGVHALGQVASFSIERAMTADTLIRAVNARLPDAVRVVAAVEAAPGFNARFDARVKTYRYRLWNADVMNPFERRYAWHVPGTLDVERMADAARAIEGRHDFAAFQAAGSAAKTTVRTVASSRVDATGRDGLLVYEVTGDGFLRHMVRTIVGTLVETGRQRRSVESMRETIASRDRAAAGPTAPAEGLFLTSVVYDEGSSGLRLSESRL